MEIDIQHIASLSRLKIETEEEDKFAKELVDIIKMVENLAVNKDDGALIDPDNPMIMREDIPEKVFNRDELLKNAPQVQAGCVVVPKVVE